MIFYWLAIAALIPFSFKMRSDIEKSKANCECGQCDNDPFLLKLERFHDNFNAFLIFGWLGVTGYLLITL